MKTTLAIAALTAFAVSTGAALAAKPKPIEQFKNWGAYTFDDKSRGKVCYILAVPNAKAPADRDHGDVYFLVSAKTTKAYETQVEVGYELKDGEDVSVQIGKRSFEMFTKNNHAWLKDTAKEDALVAAMRKGSVMKVSARSKKGTQTSYTYSLSGVTAALRAIRNCPKG